MKEHFIIYAPAINPSTGGGHSILEGFLSSVGDNLAAKSWKFIGHRDYQAICKQRNIEFIELNLNRRWFKRILYDLLLFKIKFLSKEVPDSIIVSMQNTTPLIRDGDLSLTYLHQAIPFIEDFHPNPFKQLRLFLLRYFYILFIKIGIVTRKSFFIVQSEWLKDLISKRFKLKNNHIFIHRPSPTDINPTGLVKKQEDAFFYPAIYQKYKNHSNLLSAFILAAKENKSKIYELWLTLDQSSLDCVFKDKSDLPANLIVKNLGVLSRLETLQRISNSKAVIFPSLIESYGMPLAEALFLKTPVIASKLPYAQELLEDNATYFDPLSINSIKQAIVDFSHDSNVSTISISKHKFLEWNDILTNFLSTTKQIKDASI